MVEKLRTPPRVATSARASTTHQVHEDPLLASYTQTEAPREVPAAALGGAVASWFAIVYAVCYIALPTAASALGLYSGMIANLIPNTLALGMMAFFTTIMAMVLRPKIVTKISAPRDPVLAGALGSFTVWALAQEFLPTLQSLSTMPILESLTFSAFNMVEAGMFGMMLASFARTPARAFALGVAFQALLLSMFTGWI